jgi:hypothetical protein
MHRCSARSYRVLKRSVFKKKRSDDVHDASVSLLNERGRQLRLVSSAHGSSLEPIVRAAPSTRAIGRSVKTIWQRVEIIARPERGIVQVVAKQATR